MENVKEVLAKNLIKLRQKNNLTQSELAKKLNYTDKSVSKWEHGDTTPPIDVIKELADLYGVSVDFLLSESSDDFFDKKYNIKKNNTNKIIITSLAFLCVWLVTLVAFFYSSINKIEQGWRVFIFAIPVSLIVLLVFNSIWGKRKYIFILISLLIWSLLTSLYFYNLSANIWMVYLLGIPLQVATILWSQLKIAKK